MTPNALFPVPRYQEELMIEQLSEHSAWKQKSASDQPGKLLSNTLGFGQFAATYGKLFPKAEVSCYFFELYGCRAAETTWQGFPGYWPPNANAICQADLPTDPIDKAVWFISHRGEAELARESMQQAHDRLKVGGELWTVTDNPRDNWLQGQMQELFSKVHRQAAEKGVIYWGTKSVALKKRRDFSCQFPARVDEHLLQIRTRPGVFSHRHVDPGARALLRHVKVEPGERILDYGCGSGIVALGLAKRQGTSEVVAVDSHTRAVESAQWGAIQNQLTNVQVRLGCDGGEIEANAFDVAAINPPYFGNYRLAEHFVEVSQRALRPKGRIFVVTKTPQWYVDHLPAAGFSDVSSVVEKNYHVVFGVKR